MSIEALKDYSKRVMEDPEVKVEAKKLGLGDLAGQIDYAKGLGYSFSMEDIQELAKEVEGQLSEEELESVAGGFAFVGVAAVAAAAGVVSAGAGVVSAGAAVTSTTSGSGW